MYLINTKIMNYLRYTFCIGTALLLSFILPTLEYFRLISIGFLMVAYWLNRVYPYGIIVNENQLMIKSLLAKEYKVFPLKQVQIVVAQGEQFLQVNIEGKKRYRISKDQLSIRLYNQLTPFIKNN